MAADAEVLRTGRSLSFEEDIPTVLGPRHWLTLKFRVPTPTVSVVDFKFLAKRETTKDEVNMAIRRAAEQELKGILAVTDQPNVSADFNHDSHSSVFHVDQTKVMDGKLVRVLSWYDNEWGFSNRMADTAVAMGKLL